MQFRHSSSDGRGRCSTNEALVTDLLPNTDYRFSVRMRSSMADVVRRPDLWSPPLETVLRTLPTGELTGSTPHGHSLRPAGHATLQEG